MWTHGELYYLENYEMKSEVQWQGRSLSINDADSSEDLLTEQRRNVSEMACCLFDRWPIRIWAGRRSRRKIVMAD